MALIFHYGSSGAGKTGGMYDRIIKEASENLRTNYLIIVPEQFTLQTQRDIMRLHPSGGIMNIDVLSFLRLAHRIFNELGRRTGTVLEDAGKGMIVKKVLLNNEDRLKQYRGKIHQQGFIGEMKSVISEFYQYDIGMEDIDRMKELAGDRPLLLRKLEDISVVYQEFKNFLEGRFITNEEITDKLCDVAEESAALRNSVICFDGYTGFTPSQYKLIRCLISYVRDIHVTITIDVKSLGRVLPEHDLFYLSYKTIKHLKKLADEKHISISEFVYKGQEEGKGTRFSGNKYMDFLERNIFRYPYEVCDEEQDSIRVFRAVNPEAEINRIISEINRLVIERNYRYRDIAVVTGNMGLYVQIADRAFSHSDIAYFIDEQQDIMKNPLIELIRSVLDIADSNYSYESVFRYIKCGLGPLSQDESWILENYVIAKGIRGSKMWSESWRTSYKTKYSVDIDYINSAREKVYNSLSEVMGYIKGKAEEAYSVRDRLKAIYEFLVRENIEERIYARAQKDKLSKEFRKRLESKGNEQIYRLVIELFDKIAALLGEDVLSEKEFSEILETGFKETKLKQIPPGTDSVVIGDIERTRLNNIKVLFLCGVNEGIIPRAGSEGGILSDNERRMFAENAIELSPTKRQNAYMSEFYLYLCMTKPSDMLILSCHDNDSGGKSVRPSYLLGRVKKLFAKLELSDSSQAGDDSYILLGADRGIGRLALLLQKAQQEELKPAEKSLMGILRKKAPGLYSRFSRLAGFVPASERLESTLCKGLYGGIPVSSVTRFEQYASCAFAHFLRYGLELEERKEYTIRGVDLGNIYHKALELYFKSINERNIKWNGITDLLRRQLEDECLRQATADYSGILTSSGRNEYVQARIQRVLDRTLRILEYQISSGSFEPAYIEKRFDYSSEGMKLTGKIDRIDICEADGKKYFRVIDYKSGSSEFDLTKLYYGLQLQLAVYMERGTDIVRGTAGYKGEEQIIPAGLLYYNIDDPIIDESDEQETAVLREQRLKGPVNKSRESIILHDRAFLDAAGGLAASVKSNVIQVGTKKDGSFSTASKLADGKNFRLLADYAKQLLQKAGENISTGDTAIAPYRLSGKTSCDYCIYGNICGFNRRLGNCYRELSAYSESDIWERIDGQRNKEG